MRIDCMKWRELLDAHLEGALAAEARQDFLDHMDFCDECRELHLLVAADLPELSDVDTPDLAVDVLAATTGGACRRAEELLGRRTGGDLTEMQGCLLDAHLEHCTPCSELARTLAWVLPALGELAAPVLDGAYTYDVLRATSAARARKRAGHVTRSLDRVQAWWGEQIQRPQFAWEVSFAATVALVLVFGTPYSPAREAPARALEVVQASPGWIVGAVRELVGDAGEGIADLKTGLDDRRNRTAPDRSDLRRHGRNLGESLLQGDLPEASVDLKSVRGDLDKLWETWRRGDLDTLETTDPSDHDR
jgi:predicted anti-sigma-YlaC factor YlaD